MKSEMQILRFTWWGSVVLTQLECDVALILNGEISLC